MPDGYYCVCWAYIVLKSPQLLFFFSFLHNAVEHRTKTSVIVFLRSHSDILYALCKTNFYLWNVLQFDFIPSKGESSSCFVLYQKCGEEKQPFCNASTRNPRACDKSTFFPPSRDTMEWPLYTVWCLTRSYYGCRQIKHECNNLNSKVRV